MVFEDSPQGLFLYLRGGKAMFNKLKAKSLRNMGNENFKKGNYQEAIADYEKSIKLNLHNSTAFNNLGVAYENLNKFENAEYYYKKAIQVSGNDPNPYINLIQLYEGKTEYLKALEICSQVWGKYSPTDEFFEGVLNLCEKGLKDTSEDSPDQYQLLNYQVFAFQRLRKFPEAIESCKRLIERSFDTIRKHIAYNQLATLCHQAGLHEKAIEHYKTVKALEEEIPCNMHTSKELMKILQTK